MRAILLISLMPFCSFAQSEKQADISNPIRVKSYSTSAGTFTLDYTSEIQRTAMLDKIDFTEETFKTSDGGTATFVFNREALEYEEEIGTASSVEVLLFPNPINQTAHGMIRNAELDFQNTIFVISDLLGREIKKIKVNDAQFSFEKGNLSDGMYFFQLMDNTQIVCSGKFITNSNH